MVSTSIIESCLLKNNRAYKALYEASIPYVYSIAKRYIKDTEDRKDIVQEIFAKVFSNLESYDKKKGEFKPWIRKISVNTCLMFLRKHSKTIIYSIDEQLENTFAQENTHILDQITRDDVLDLLSKMPERYKMVFMAYIIDGYDHTEIGEMLNISKDTSRSQLSRAKKWVIKNIKNNNKYTSYGLF